MNGKKVLSVLLSMMLFSLAASAQMVKASFGVTGGGIATQMNTDPATSTPFYINGYGGAFATINLGKVIGIRGGANYSMQGGNYTMSSTEITASQTYINIPVSLLLNVKSAMAFEFGFYQNILLDSKYSENGKSKVEITPDEGALAYNFGALAGITFNLGRAAFLSFRYNYGLSNSYVIYGKGYTSNFITAGLGFNIVNTRKKAF